MPSLVLLRHGESTWNRDNRFTGWYDADLSEQGVAEARDAGRRMAAEGLEPQVVHTSLLVRAIRTAELALHEMGLSWLPVRRHWRLNERHYGALQGLNKAETAERYGHDQVFVWRRSYDTPPPPLEPDDERQATKDPRYADLPPELMPASECLADVVRRALPYWYDAIVPDLAAGRCVLVSAHGNSLRALVKHLDGISDADIPALNIPTGLPLFYELDGEFRKVSARYLADPDEVEAKAHAVASQAEGTPDGSTDATDLDGAGTDDDTGPA